MLLPIITLAAVTTIGEPAFPAAPVATAPSAPSMDETTRALVARLTDVTGRAQDDGRRLRATTNFSMSVADGDRTFVITSRDGTVSASVNGKEIPADRIRVEEDAYVILGEQGEVLHRVPVSISRFGNADFEARLQGLARRGGDAGREWFGRLEPDALPRAGELRFKEAPAAAPPATMLGVHLEEPGDVLRAQLGLEPSETTVVSGVLTGLPADAGGLQPFDVIIAIDGTAPAGPAAIREATADAQPGDQLVLTVLRRGTPRDVTITLEAWDARRMSSAAVEGRVAGEQLDQMALLFPGEDRDPFGRGDERILEGQPLFIAPDGKDGDGDVRVFRGPGRFSFTLPGGGGRLELDGESMGELRQSLDRILEELQGELRRELPQMMDELREEAVEVEPLIRQQLEALRPLIREQIVELQPMIREQIIELQPMIREQMQAHGPKIAEAIMLAEQVYGKDPQEIAAIIVERFGARDAATDGGDAPATVEVRVAPAPGGSGEAGTLRPQGAQRVEQLEDRMARIERLLERMLERLEARDRN